MSEDKDLKPKPSQGPVGQDDGVPPKPPVSDDQPPH